MILHPAPYTLHLATCTLHPNGAHRCAAAWREGPFPRLPDGRATPRPRGRYRNGSTQGHRLALTVCAEIGLVCLVCAGFKESRTENCSSQGQKLAVTVLHVQDSLDKTQLHGGAHRVFRTRGRRRGHGAGTLVERRGNNQNDCKDSGAENGSSHGHDLALTVLCVPNSIDATQPHGGASSTGRGGDAEATGQVHLSNVEETP